jgi:hypothetical protein
MSESTTEDADDLRQDAYRLDRAIQHGEVMDRVAALEFFGRDDLYLRLVVSHLNDPTKVPWDLCGASS